MVILYHLKITFCFAFFSDELQAFKAAFDMFDKNGDGTISTKVKDILLVIFLVKYQATFLHEIFTGAPCSDASCRTKSHRS